MIDSRPLPPEQEAIRAKCFHPTGEFVEFRSEKSSNRLPILCSQLGRTEMLARVESLAENEAQRLVDIGQPGSDQKFPFAK